MHHGHQSETVKSITTILFSDLAFANALGKSVPQFKSAACVWNQTQPIAVATSNFFMVFNMVNGFCKLDRNGFRLFRPDRFSIHEGRHGPAFELPAGER